MNKKEALERISNWDWWSVPEEFYKDKSFVLAAVKRDGRALEFADKSLKKDKSIVLAAVRTNGYALEYTDKSLKKDKSIVLAAVKRDGGALEYADKSLKKDKSIVLAAVKQDGFALEYADKSLKKDKSIVLAAVKTNRYALGYADESLRKDLQEKKGISKKEKETITEKLKSQVLELKLLKDKVEIDKSGHRFNCQYVDGKKEGPGEIVFGFDDNFVSKTVTKGSILKGNWKSDKLNGECIYSYINGDKWICNVTDDHLDGKLIYYNADGTILYDQRWIKGELYNDDELTWDELKNNFIPKDKIGRFESLPKTMQFKFGTMYTGVVSYLIGDHKIIKDLFGDKNPNNNGLEDEMDGASFCENEGFNKKINNYLTLHTVGDQNAHYYYSDWGLKVDFLFIPTFLIGQTGAQADNAEAFSNQNKPFIQNILSHIDSKKTDWIKLGELKTPSERIYIGEANSAGCSYDEIEKTELATHYKGFDIYGVVTDRDELLKVYNDQYDIYNYVSTNLLWKANDHLPNDKAFHGILLLGKSYLPRD